MATAIAGPFNTFASFNIADRLIYWGLVVVIALTLSYTIRFTIDELIEDAPYWKRGALLVAGMTLFLTPVIMAMNAFGLHESGLEQPPFLRLALFVAAISTLISIIRYFVEISNAVPSSVAAPVSGGQAMENADRPLPRLHARLPEGNHGVIQRLSADDHFVMIHTESGAYQVRMRFADAIAEMDEVIGHCTHRSHWVVAKAVEGVEREGAKLFLLVGGGARVPVSRKYRSGLETAGLIRL